jgi:hypothetical protein
MMNKFHKNMIVKNAVKVSCTLLLETLEIDEQLEIAEKLLREAKERAKKPPPPDMRQTGLEL